MARYALRGIVTDIYGNSISGATVTVREEGGYALATIYSAKTGGSAISGSVVTSDDTGMFKFYVESETYKYPYMFHITFAKTGYTTRIEEDVMP